VAEIVTAVHRHL